MLRIRLTSFTRVGVMAVLFLWVGVPARSEEPAPSTDAGSACPSAQECFRSAFTPLPAGSSEERRRLQSERLRFLRQQFPGTVWSQRAGIALGLLAAERDPVEAVRLFANARTELPVLEDYLRYWEAETRMRAGEVPEAAQLFESVVQSTPGTLLKARSAFSAGQAWLKASDCGKAKPLLRLALAADPQDTMAPPALLGLADCDIRENAVPEARTTLTQTWVKYPNTPAAREAFASLNKMGDGGTWAPAPDDLYGRAQAFIALGLLAEAVEELQRFLAVSPAHPRRTEARLKLGTTLMRLKRYEQARAVFQEVLDQRADGVGEAAVSLARIHLRLNDDVRLLALRDMASGLPLSSEQRASILFMAGIWLEDQRRFDQAVATYREAIQAGAGGNQRSEMWWRIGWIHYRNGQWRDALERFDELLKAGKNDPQWAPQVLYWKARVLERQGDPQAAEVYHQVCRQFALTYYCQLARGRVDLAPPSSPVFASMDDADSTAADHRAVIERDPHYRKAQELKLLKREADAARELSSLTERYGRDRSGALALSSLLSEAGAHSEALRLARLNFRDSLERGGDHVPASLWTVAYPAVYLPTIRLHAGPRLDPYLAAAIIREESQYDARAVSRAGALGLMQLMPDTARSMARRLGGPEVVRDDLFNQDINIRYGTRYLEQLVDQFSGNVVYAIAAYNAGPPAVSAWVAKNGATDPEEFVEMVPYTETRQYLKRVLRSYWEYRRLSGEPCRGRLLDKVC